MQDKVKGGMRRRMIIGVPVALVLGTPVARVLYMRTKDNLMDPVREPDIVFANGWLLDAGDRFDAAKP